MLVTVALACGMECLFGQFNSCYPGRRHASLPPGSPCIQIPQIAADYVHTYSTCLFYVYSFCLWGTCSYVHVLECVHDTLCGDELVHWCQLQTVCANLHAMNSRVVKKNTLHSVVLLLSFLLT